MEGKNDCSGANLDTAGGGCSTAVNCKAARKREALGEPESDRESY